MRGVPAAQHARRAAPRKPLILRRLRALTPRNPAPRLRAAVELADPFGDAENPFGMVAGDNRSPLDELGRKIEQARADGKPEDAAGGGATDVPAMRQAAIAYRIFLELLVGTLLGAGLGWLADRGFGTRPWGLVVMTVLGFAAGVSAMIRSVRSLQRELDRRD